MKAIYNFVAADTGFDLGNLNGLELPVCPRAGEIVVFAADGQPGEVSYTVEQVRHIVHRNLDGELTQIVDVMVRPVTTDRVQVRELTPADLAERYGSKA